MKNRMNAVPRRAVRTVDAGRPREAEPDSEVLDRPLFSWLRGALLATAPGTMEELIFFGEGSSGLDGRARAILRDRSAVLRANPRIRIVIGGIASQSGSTADALGLGLRRVQTIRTFLRSQDIDAARIEVAIRGAEWFLVDSPHRVAENGPSGECRLQIADPQWALLRN